MPVLPPIRLVDYYVEHLGYDVVAKPGSDVPEDENPPFHNVGIDVTFDDPREDEAADEGADDEREFRTFRVTVNLNQSPETPETVFYRATVRIAGLFEVQSRTTLNPAPSAEEYLMHCLASVVSTLYGSAREVLAPLTASSPFPKVMLPSISPTAVAQHMLQKLRSREEVDES